MVDREQEQARQLADAFGPDGRAGRDLAWIVSVGVLLACAAVLTDAADPVLEWAGGLSGRGLSGIMAILILTPVGATLYAARRYRDAARAAAQLDHLATHDPLTDLPNRRFLGEPFDDMLALARRQHRRVGVLFVDLEGVKRINEMYGHEVGDELLTSIADRFRRVAGPEDVVVRYAGDEFVFLCPDLTNAGSAERLATRIIQAVEAPFALDGDHIRITACVGVAITEDRPSRADEVLSDADAAMHQARRQGPGSYALFDRSMREQLTPATAERRLRTAIENGEFRLYYQPIVSLWTKRLVGVEALLRWHDPVRGVTGAEEFMPALEETGLIVPVGSWILEEVCRQSRAWQDAHPDRPALNIKVNISARQLAQATFVAHLRESLEASRADPDRICLEVNETGLLHDVDAAWATLRDAKALGVSLALDDFGTGYSSLSFLRRFSLDLLSIDRSFVHGIGRSREDTTIVEHVIGMAKALGIVTVAEGVETEEQMLHLRSLNCDLAQGWYFSEPQPPAVISQLLADTGSRQEWRPPPRTDESDAAVVRVDRFEPVRASLKRAASPAPREAPRMPLPLELIGASTEPITQAVDARWTMAYAAALEDLDDRYFDTRRGPVLAHPLFPVCIEWAAVAAARRLADPAILTREEAARGVHATHDLVLHRPVRAGDLLTTTATVELIEVRRPGAYQVLRLDTVDSSGAPVCTTRMGSLFLGVSVSGTPPARRCAEPPTELPGLEPRERPTQVLTRAISATAAHVYTECSRIWNPIHTDVAVAERAGLPGPILHGTATLALAVSTIIRSSADDDPTSVHRVAGRFGAMVTMPSEVTVHLRRPDERWISFEVWNQQGHAVIRDGLVGLRT